MDGFQIETQLRSMNLLTPLQSGLEAPSLDDFELGARPAAPGAASGASFKDVLARQIGEVNALEAEADRAITGLANGTSGNVHEALIAMQRAELSMRLLVQVRNKLVEALDETMRMQV